MMAPIQDLHPHYWLIAYVAVIVLAAGVVGRRLEYRRGSASIR